LRLRSEDRGTRDEDKEGILSSNLEPISSNLLCRVSLHLDVFEQPAFDATCCERREETMAFSYEGPDEHGTLTLRGELTIQNVSALKEALLYSLAKAPGLRVHLEGVEESDLSGLQVLCSAHRAAVASGKSMAIAGQWPGPFARVVEAAGYLRGGMCRTPGASSCFWRSGGRS
jgi:anti-anti-sigma factor